MPKVTTATIPTLNEAAKLPSPIGRVVTVKLSLLPAYFSIHNLEPNTAYPYPKPGTAEGTQVLIVKKRNP